MKKIVSGLVFVFLGAFSSLAIVLIVVVNYEREYFFQSEPVGDRFLFVKNMYGMDLLWGFGLSLLALGLVLTVCGLFFKSSTGCAPLIVAGIGFLFTGCILYFGGVLLTLTNLDSVHYDFWDTMIHRGLLPHFLLGAGLLLFGMILTFRGAFMKSNSRFLQKTISGAGLLFTGILLYLLPMAIIANPSRRLTSYSTEFAGASGGIGYTMWISGMYFCFAASLFLLGVSCMILLQGIYLKKASNPSSNDRMNE